MRKKMMFYLIGFLLAAGKGKIGDGQIHAAMERVGLDPKDGKTVRKYSRA